MMGVKTKIDWLLVEANITIIPDQEENHEHTRRD